MIVDEISMDIAREVCVRGKACDGQRGQRVENHTVCEYLHQNLVVGALERNHVGGIVVSDREPLGGEVEGVRSRHCPGAELGFRAKEGLGEIPHNHLVNPCGMGVPNTDDGVVARVKRRQDCLCPVNIALRQDTRVHKDSFGIEDKDLNPADLVLEYFRLAVSLIAECQLIRGTTCTQVLLDAAAGHCCEKDGCCDEQKV